MRSSSLKGLQLPSELVHNFITLIIVEYLDDAITGRATTLLSGGLGHNFVFGSTPCSVPEIANEDEDLTLLNPVPPLLQSSLQLRNITLEILSEVLGIPIVADGSINRLQSKPWNYINATRLVFANPHVLTNNEDTALHRRAAAAADASVLLRCYQYVCQGTTGLVERFLHSGAIGSGAIVPRALLTGLQDCLSAALTLRSGLMRFLIDDLGNCVTHFNIADSFGTCSQILRSNHETIQNRTDSIRFATRDCIEDMVIEGVEPSLATSLAKSAPSVLFYEEQRKADVARLHEALLTATRMQQVVCCKIDSEPVSPFTWSMYLAGIFLSCDVLDEVIEYGKHRNNASDDDSDDNEDDGGEWVTTDTAFRQCKEVARKLYVKLVKSLPEESQGSSGPR